MPTRLPSRLLVLTLPLLLAALQASAQQKLPDPSRVAVSVTADDSVGLRLVYQIKELLRASKGMSLVPEEESGVQLHVVTLDPDDPDGGLRTVYSITWTAIGRGLQVYWTSTVGTCGGSKVESCAASIVATTDKVVTEIQDIHREAGRRTKKPAQ